jgi:hypothetical protein
VEVRLPVLFTGYLPVRHRKAAVINAAAIGIAVKVVFSGTAVINALDDMIPEEFVTLQRKIE